MPVRRIQARTAGNVQAEFFRDMQVRKQAFNPQQNHTRSEFFVANRSTREVIEDHLSKRQNSFEEDLEQNYSKDVVLLTCTGVYNGHPGVRDSYRILQELLPGARFEYSNLTFAGEFAFLEWRGILDSIEANEGADSFIVKNGKIVAQSIHYKVEPRLNLSA